MNIYIHSYDNSDNMFTTYVQVDAERLLALQTEISQLQLTQLKLGLNLSEIQGYQSYLDKEFSVHFNLIYDYKPCNPGNNPNNPSD